METLNTIRTFECIVKRDGKLVKFDSSKITNAILKAAKTTGEFDGEIAKKLTIKVLALAKELKLDIPTVEQIQDIVEEVLLASPYKKTAKAYILYRQQHKEIRQIASKFNVELVEKYLTKSDWQVKENSNMDFSLQGLNNYISSEISKIYWLNKIYPLQIQKAHIDGDFHIHDLGIISTYCVGWDLYDLLLEGFRGAIAKIESLPAKHFRTALGQVCNFFYTLQGEAAGAQAFSNFDTLLAPFIRFDGLDYKAVKQTLQEFLFNVNVPTRVGFQTPFTNISLDLDVFSYYADQPVIIGGKPQKYTYKEFKKEMQIFNKALLTVMLEGDAKKRAFTFPIPTYNITKDFDWDNPNFEILWELTAKYGIAYFANFINSELNPQDIRSMCCRLRIDNRQLYRRAGGLFGPSPLTGSIGVVTINMPRLGFVSKDKNDFFDRLKNIMELAKTSLEIKRKVLESFTENGLYPYMRFYLRNVKKRFGLYWKNHFSTIGLIGVNEACLNLLGKDIVSIEGKNFAIEILNFMRKKLLEFQEETGNLYNLEATPAEGASFRLALIDKQKYPQLLTSYGKLIELKNPFYTNSTNLPVNFTDDIFYLLKHQEDLQNLYTGGTVVHIYIGEEIKDYKAVKNLVKKICTNFKIPYFTITPTFSICPNCGYLAGKIEKCPKCENICEIYSRIVGYLRPTNQWNDGKQQEFALRKTFKL